MYDLMLSGHGVSCFSEKDDCERTWKCKGWTVQKIACFFVGERKYGEDPVNLHTRHRVGGFFLVSCCLFNTSKFVVSCFHRVVVRWSQHSRSAGSEPGRAKFGGGNDMMFSRPIPGQALQCTV